MGFGFNQLKLIIIVVKKIYVFLSLALFTLALTAKADDILVQSTNYSVGQIHFFGQSFTTPDDGTADVLTGFNWFTAAAPSGSGILYLFTSVYAGTPTDLSTAGALAEATWNATTKTYDFSLDDITLQPDTKYYVYTDTSHPESLNANGTDVYPGGEIYMASSSGSSFTTSSGEDMAFQVTVSTTPTPEPSTLAFAGIGGLGAFFMARRRKVILS